MEMQKKGASDMAQIYQVISIVAFCLAGVSFLLGIFFWLKFNIWKIIGDLSGRTARKSIEQIRTANEMSGKKSHRPTPVAVSRGKLTEPIELGKKTKSAQKEEEDTVVLQYSSNGTELLEPGKSVLEKSFKKEFSKEAATFEILQSIVVTHTSEVI